MNKFYFESTFLNLIYFKSKKFSLGTEQTQSAV